jgi:hypothetical protein
MNLQITIFLSKIIMKCGDEKKGKCGIELVNQKIVESGNMNLILYSF